MHQIYKNIGLLFILMFVVASLSPVAAEMKENDRYNLTPFKTGDQIPEIIQDKIDSDGLEGLPVSSATMADPPMEGIDCFVPYHITLPQDMPFIHSNQQTCGHFNDYIAGDMCFDLGWGGGEDYTYEIEVTEPVTVEFTLDPKGTAWTCFEIRTECEPPNGECVGFFTNSGSTPYSSSAVFLDPGTYYVHIDTWPSPDCIPDYDFSINDIFIEYLECPDGSVVEDEGDDENLNGGCTMEEDPQWEVIDCGTIFCGSVWADGSERDTDWFEFTVDEPTEVTLTGMAEFGMQLFILKPDPTCENIYVLAETHSENTMTELTCGTSLVPGTYWAWAGPLAFDYFDPEQGDYNIELNCDNANSYCYAEGGCDEYIERVQFGDIDNSSNCGYYSDFTDISAPVNPGGTYPITITVGDPYSQDIGAVWIDWNDDYVFDESEKVSLDVFTGYGPYTGNIEIPYDVEMGEYRMRVRLQFQGEPLPCGTTSYGEVEDYTIELGTFDYITMQIVPEEMHWADGNLTQQEDVAVYLSETEPFFMLDDVITESINVNGLIPRHVNSWTGEMEIIVDKASFVQGYGIIWDGDDYEYTLHLAIGESGTFDIPGEVTLVGHISGDVNNDRAVNINDIIYMIDFKYKEGNPPIPIDEVADANADGSVDIRDIIYMIEFKFKEGPAPQHP